MLILWGRGGGLNAGGLRLAKGQRIQNQGSHHRVGMARPRHCASSSDMLDGRTCHRRCCKLQARRRAQRLTFVVQRLPGGVGSCTWRSGGRKVRSFSRESFEGSEPGISWKLCWVSRTPGGVQNVAHAHFRPQSSLVLFQFWPSYIFIHFRRALVNVIATTSGQVLKGRRLGLGDTWQINSDRGVPRYLNRWSSFPCNVHRLVSST